MRVGAVLLLLTLIVSPLFISPTEGKGKRGGGEGEREGGGGGDYVELQGIFHHFIGSPFPFSFFASTSFTFRFLFFLFSQ